MSDNYFDLYLFVVPNSDKLTKIEHLTRSDAEKYANYWFEMNELHDYMLVLEGDHPWLDENKPSIEVKSPEWISLEYANLCKR